MKEMDTEMQSNSQKIFREFAGSINDTILKLTHVEGDTQKYSELRSELKKDLQEVKAEVNAKLDAILEQLQKH
jgi:hypothetical protein